MRRDPRVFIARGSDVEVFTIPNRQVSKVSTRIGLPVDTTGHVAVDFRPPTYSVVKELLKISTKREIDLLPPL